MDYEIIDNLSFDAYCAIDAVNAGRLKTLALRGPSECRTAIATTHAMLRGRGLHAAVLEPDEWRDRWTWFDGVRRGKRWSEFAAAHVGDEILTEPEHALVTRLCRLVYANKHAADTLDGARREVTIVWTHERTGTRIKSRIDFLRDDLWGDLKSTSIQPAELDTMTGESSAARPFINDCFRRMYHLQLGLYADGLAACGFGALPCRLIAAQTTEPHVVAVMNIGEDWLDAGRWEYEQALDLYAQCVARDEWPAIGSDRILEPPAPSWALRDVEIDVD